MHIRTCVVFSIGKVHGGHKARLSGVANEKFGVYRMHEYGLQRKTMTAGTIPDLVHARLHGRRICTLRPELRMLYLFLNLLHTAYIEVPRPRILYQAVNISPE